MSPAPITFHSSSSPQLSQGHPLYSITLASPIPCPLTLHPGMGTPNFAGDHPAAGAVAPEIPGQRGSASCLPQEPQALGAGPGRAN